MKTICPQCGRKFPPESFKASVCDDCLRTRYRDTSADPYEFWREQYKRQYTNEPQTPPPKPCTGKPDCTCESCVMRRAKDRFERMFEEAFFGGWARTYSWDPGSWSQQSPPPRRGSDEPARVDIPEDILKQLILLCHPDKHGGSKLAHDVTVWLLKQRSYRKASGL